MTEEKPEKLKCKKCGNVWLPRVKDPVQCPRCKAPKWQEKRVYKDF